MGARGLSRCGAVLVVLMVLGGRAAAQPAPAANNSDLDFGKPPKYPTLITPTPEGGELKDNHHGESLTLQEFAFNPATHEVGLAKNSTGPHRAYADSRIDSANYNSDLTLFDYLTTDRTPIGKIVILSAKKKLIVSPNYVVSINKSKPTPIDPSSYTAAVQFEKGEESNKPGTTITVRRNEDKPAPLADAVYSKISRKTDVITWSIERGGAVVKTGSFGFPVVAVEPDLVKYVIQLP